MATKYGKQNKKVQGTSDGGIVIIALMLLIGVVGSGLIALSLI